VKHFFYHDVEKTCISCPEVYDDDDDDDDTQLDLLYDCISSFECEHAFFIYSIVIFAILTKKKQ
jgi:hypothetical protein